MKMCFDCMGEVVYTDSFALTKAPVKGTKLALVLKSDIGEHILGVYTSDAEFNKALQDVQRKAEDVIQGVYGNKVVHIFAKESYKERMVFPGVESPKVFII